MPQDPSFLSVFVASCSRLSYGFGKSNFISSIWFFGKYFAGFAVYVILSIILVLPVGLRLGWEAYVRLVREAELTVWCIV